MGFPKIRGTFWGSQGYFLGVPRRSILVGLFGSVLGPLFLETTVLGHRVRDFESPWNPIRA